MILWLYTSLMVVKQCEEPKKLVTLEEEQQLLSGHLIEPD